MEDAQPQQKAQALVKRGDTRARWGSPGIAVGDYTSVIQMPNAPLEWKARALIGRGISFMATQSCDSAQKDFSSVIRKPGVPPRLKAWALLERGAMYHGRNRKGDWQREVDDCSAVIATTRAGAGRYASGQ